MLETVGKYLATAGVALGLALGASGAVRAQPEGEQDVSAAPQREDRGTSTPLVWFEPHVRMRFRPELLLGGDLAEGESVVESGLGAASDEVSVLRWASTRLRLDTTIHAGSRLAVQVGLGVLEGRVLGATPGLPALGGLGSGGWVNPSIQAVDWRDTLRVHQVYGNWRFLEWLDVTAGRMREHFGLGLYRSAGECRDCDHETLIDGVRVGASIFGLDLDASYELLSTGATTDLPSGPLSEGASSAALQLNGSEAQGQDLGDKDDLRSLTFRIGQPKGDETETTASSSFQWQLLSSFVNQELSSSEPALSDLPAGCSVLAETANGTAALPTDCWLLVPRHVSFWKPGIWLRADWRLDGGASLRLEFEGAAVFGEVGNLQRRPDLGNIGKRFSGLGGAVEAEYRTGDLQIGLDAGFATGDDGEYLGFADGQNILVPDDGLYEDNANGALRANRTVTSFWFHPSYRLDQILFRQVIGTVTNAIYAKPWVARELMRVGDVRLTGRLDALYAAAARPIGTPGQGRSYGVEVDGRLMLQLPRGLEISTTAGVLVPLDALANRETGETGDPALSVRGLLSWRY